MIASTLRLPHACVALDDLGTGPTIVLLHAGGADRTMFDDQITDLARDHRVVRFDTPGSGDSPAPDEPIDLVELAVDVLDALDVPTAALVGISQGGTVALDLAAEHPDRVTSVVAMSCAAHDQLAAEGPDYAAIDVFRALAAGDIDTAVRRYLELWCASTTHPTTDGRVRQLVERNIGSLLLTLTGRASLPTWPTAERLGHLTLPVALVYGSDDDPALLRAGDALATLIPGATHHVLPGADHFLTVREPEACLDIIRRTVDEARDGRGHGVHGS